MINWYSEVSRSLAKIPDCVAYFDKELLEARKQCKIYGNLERASAALPGIVEERFSQLQQLEAILEYLNIELRRLRSKTFRKFLENYNRALSSRDAEKYVDGEDDVVDLTKIVNDFAEPMVGHNQGPGPETMANNQHRQTEGGGDGRC
jgi:hypothetical protein